MLDAYIIDQLRREQERARESYIPLYIEPPPPPTSFDEEERHKGWEVEEESQHGVVIIDYFGDGEED